ncbi:MAG: DUF1638 domain-containing protein [Candidatus Omnitrophica bacterium]|nr:DUF1638 domain-containing protein [Candidatus Omnitrophota bacterium]
MDRKTGFKGYSIVSCGTLRRELAFLNQTAFLNADKILYTAPGLHEVPSELKGQLKKQINNAKKYSENIIVIYGNRCYIDIKDPARDIERIIQESVNSAVRIKAKNCIDMFVSPDERENISGGQKVYWLSWGWMEHWKIIFKDWDKGKANETFPQHDKAILLDPLGIFDRYCQEHPQQVLEFADWMRLPIEPCGISLDRFKNLLLETVSS